MRKVLIILHESFLEKLLCKVKSCVVNELAHENYIDNIVHDDDEFKQNVEKFEFELVDQS